MTEKISDKELILKHLSPPKEIPFSTNEYRQRLNRVRETMTREKIDLLFLSAPESLFYISGYQAEWYQAQSTKLWPPASGTAVHVDHDNFIHFDTEEEEILSRFTSISTDTRIYRETTETTGMPSWIAKELKKEGWLPGTVGLEMWSYRPNRAVSEMFQSALEKEGCKVVDGTDIVREVRAIKSPQEIAYIEKAAEIADIGMNAAIESIRPGMTELEVYGEIVHAMAKAGGENPGIPVLVTSGPKTASLHALSSRKKIQRGEMINVDICGVYNRYHADIARSLSIGKPNPDVAKVVELSAKAYDVIAKLIRPNLPVAEFNQKMKAYYEEAGILQDKWWVGGYELGIAFPPDWVGEFVYDMEIDAGDQLFVPGTVVNHESNFYLPHKAGTSYQINTLIFTEEDARIPGEIPNDLIVIER
ncbi:MAG: Xaa-Pro peptidase family protein [Candidatus Bathyarchaeota archaeon]|nr:Xaa-Pro peptidase family protein [Candidatus Bathyarchaeota archaeon]MDH5532351.1 Xaa-Pro peptidase family protein [Candidatus Bathyarchaeota archaeon]MDH5713474.1 Xaa-Pro peptidase family protein [Candidatus Bathyarchaeota archaeon]